MRNGAIHFLILLLISHLFACGQWKPATSSDLRASLEQPKKNGDRYRFTDAEGEKIESSGKNMNLENNGLLVRKNSRLDRYPLDQIQRLEKYQLHQGRTWALILGITAGVLGATAAAAFMDAGNDTDSYS